MKKLFYILLLLFGIALNAKSQISIDSVLYKIEQNNKTIQANVQFWEVKKMEYKTGLTPYNPKVEYDYLNGSPEGAGNQIEFSITQSFDFPTVYSKRKQLSREQIKQAEFQLTSAKQDILLEAKLICIELVYRDKFQSEVIKRKQSTEKWLADFQSSMIKGGRSVLDVNKAKLQLTEINADFQKNRSAINQLNQRLTELNGGVVLNLTDLSYSELIEVPSFENLGEEIKANDPIREYMEQENVIIEKKIELSKAMSLPKVEAGYRYQAILGQRFNGVHVGLTIPLWENKNKVKAQQANLEFNDLNLKNHSNERYYYIQNMYEKQLNLKLTLDEYALLFTDLNTEELLDKSLALGHISAIEYFMEMSFYYDALKNYLMTEKEYRQSVAELFKYKL